MLQVAAEYVRTRIRRKSEHIPGGYSWSFVVVMYTGMAVILVGSILQRTEADLPAATVATVVAISPLLLFFGSGIKFGPALMWVTSWTATAILLFATDTPVVNGFAPLILVLMVMVVGSLAKVVLGVLALASAAVLLLAASAVHRLNEVALYLCFVALGWLVGYLTRTQRQLLIEQQKMQAYLTERTAADERRRIAREVHDVIAHSLSITLLHVTGARRALEQDRDIDDAVDALVEAERLGRHAMADIRRTISLLEVGQTRDSSPPIAPQPGIADLPDLIHDFVQAGLPVTLRTEGEHDDVSAAVELALYRIAEESLANVAKHAPSAKAVVELTVSASAALLSIVNDMPVAVRTGPTARDGRGLPGMRQRVELLSGVIDAGPSGAGWSVRAEIPLTDSRSRRCTHVT